MKEIFKSFKEGQELFGETISAIINLILLSIIYILGVGLTSIFAKIFGKYFLDLKINKNTDSYWESLNLSKQPRETYYRQF